MVWDDVRWMDEFRRGITIANCIIISFFSGLGAICTHPAINAVMLLFTQTSAPNDVTVAFIQGSILILDLFGYIMILTMLEAEQQETKKEIAKAEQQAEKWAKENEDIYEMCNTEDSFDTGVTAVAIPRKGVKPLNKRKKAEKGKPTDATILIFDMSNKEETEK